MNYEHPHRFEDFELLLALDGEATPDINAHLQQCPVCAARAAQLKALQQRVTIRLFRADCPPSLELVEYQAGLTTPDRSTALQSHLVGCPHCRIELAQTAAMLAQPDPYLQPTGPLAGLKRQVKRLTARLSDGPAAPVLAGLRGEDNPSRTYIVDDVELILAVHNDADNIGQRSLVGLVIGLRDDEAQITLLRGEVEINRTALDSFGNFVLEHLLPGEYTLLLDSVSHAITILTLTV